MSATVRVLCPPTRSGAWSHTSAARPLGFAGSRALPLSSWAKFASPPAGVVTRTTGGGGGEEVGGVAPVPSAAGVGEARAALLQSLQGIDRGIFGIESRRRNEIDGLVRLLESRNPTLDPIEQVGGCWRLLYSTVTILGSKRTKLGLRDLVSLGDVFQKIDLVRRKAINEIKFIVRGLKMAEGQLTVVASFSVASRTRVDIRFESSDISPVLLMNLFRKNYELLLAIFNPEGWLEITYVDESIRIGRDDRGNVFVLERLGEEAI